MRFTPATGAGRSAELQFGPAPVRSFVAIALLLWAAGSGAAAPLEPKVLDPRGRIHIPIGIPDTLDTLKTFVEAEGGFSPGFGSYGISFWVWNDTLGRLLAPTMEEVPCEHGLAEGGALIPWSRWKAGEVEVKTEVCEVRRMAPPVPQDPKGYEPVPAFVTAARVHLANRSQSNVTLSVYAALRALGPAGWPINRLTCPSNGLALFVNNHTAIWSGQPVDWAGVSAGEDLVQAVLRGVTYTNGPPFDDTAEDPGGRCSGLLRFDFSLRPGEAKDLGFICPVLPGGRAVGHQWDGVSQWAQLDLAVLNPPTGGLYQFDPGPAYWSQLKAEILFEEAAAYWKGIQRRVTLRLPDPRWSESFAAIVGHAALCMNEGAPDVAVVNFNVFNRDGMYMANMFQKSGNFELAETAIDYFLRHPFNGRVQPEADNPGQILWVMGEHWRFTRSRPWLDRVYPGAHKLASMIRYYRTTPGPHWVWDTSLDYGEDLPKDRRKELKPGACDGFNPNYTEGYDIAGLRAAATLAEAAGKEWEATAWRKLAGELFAAYEQRFATNLAQGYGSYCVLWPCRLYPFGEGRAFDQFKAIGPQQPTDWRYFPLARAHQGLLAGNRAAAYDTLRVHLDHPQMRGWYAFDEGGESGVGGWNKVLTRWPQGRASVAMPHGWAIAEFHLLLRDSLAFEDGDQLVLLAGVPPEWFTRGSGIQVKNLPTHFGLCSFEYTPGSAGATLDLEATPPGGVILALPQTLKVTLTTRGRPITSFAAQGFLLPPGTNTFRLDFRSN